MVHKMRLPKKVVIYPRGFYKESAEGFMGIFFQRKSLLEYQHTKLTLNMLNVVVLQLMKQCIRFGEN